MLDTSVCCKTIRSVPCSSEHGSLRQTSPLLFAFVVSLWVANILMVSASAEVLPKTVIVVGAGAASIKLAHTLWKECAHESDRPFKVIILEANDYVGGRIRSFCFEGHTVEMGANWISGRETAFDNPIWKLAKEIQLQGHSSDRDNPERVMVVNCLNRKDVTSNYLKCVQRFDRIYANAVEQVASESGTVTPSTDQSVRSLLEKNGWTGKNELTNLERIVEHNVLEVWVAEHLEQLSGAHDMKAGANDVDLGQDEMFVEDSRGFNSIFGGMVQDLLVDDATTILLRHEVKSIHYSPGNVKVVATNFDTGEPVEYQADMIISTVSLGVLQSDAIQFVPPLPEWKKEALNEIRMFNFAKVYAKFRRRLWPEEKDYLVFVSGGENNRGYYPFWMKYKNTMDNLLMCYLGGAQARRVESLDLESIKDEIEALFRSAFGDSGGDDCRPESVEVTDWSRNRHFHGSYSYFPKGAFGTIPQEDLTRGLSGVDEDKKDHPTTLYFAGEAFDDKFNGWVQGGYLSGERTARQILQDHRPGSNTCKDIQKEKYIPRAP